LARALAGRLAFFFFKRRGGAETVAVCSSGAAVARNNCRQSHAESQAERVTALQRRVRRVLCVFFGTT